MNRKSLALGVASHYSFNQKVSLTPLVSQVLQHLITPLSSHQPSLGKPGGWGVGRKVTKVGEPEVELFCKTCPMSCPSFLFQGSILQGFENSGHDLPQRLSMCLTLSTLGKNCKGTQVPKNADRCLVGFLNVSWHPIPVEINKSQAQTCLKILLGT